MYTLQIAARKAEAGFLTKSVISYITYHISYIILVYHISYIIYHRGRTQLSVHIKNRIEVCGRQDTLF